MSNHWKIPKANPFWFIKASATPGIHFGDDWSCRMIKSFETFAVYRQKWIRSKTTKIQIESSIVPLDLFVLDQNGEVVKNIEWVQVHTAPNYKIFEAEVDFSDLDEGVYYLYSQVIFGLSIDWAAITEPIHVMDSWDNLLQFKYRNTFNDFDVSWTAAGIEMLFMCEAAIMEYDPQRDRAAYVSQVRDVVTNKAVPWDKFKLWIGEAGGVADWVLKVLNFIFSCDRIQINDKYYQSDDGSKWEITRIKGWPLAGATIDIVPANNHMSEEFADLEPLVPGVVTAYQLQTNFFGPGATVQVEEVEENG